MSKKDIQKKKVHKEKDDIDDLEQFIEKKKIQNKALKKIIERINTSNRNITDNSTIH